MQYYLANFALNIFNKQGALNYFYSWDSVKYLWVQYCEEQMKSRLLHLIFNHILIHLASQAMSVLSCSKLHNNA